MRITRVFTGDDGHSHFEDLEVPMEDRPYGLISDWLPATGVAFRVNHLDQNLDFHVAPRRQLVVNLDAVEIETQAGDVRRLGAGDILLADNLTGTGHISHDVAGPRRNLFIPLPEDLDVSSWRLRRIRARTLTGCGGCPSPRVDRGPLLALARRRRADRREQAGEPGAGVGGVDHVVDAEAARRC